MREGCKRATHYPAPIRIMKPIIVTTPPIKGESAPQQWHIAPMDYFSPSSHRYTPDIPRELEKFRADISSRLPEMRAYPLAVDAATLGDPIPRTAYRGGRPYECGKLPPRVRPFIVRGVELPEVWAELRRDYGGAISPYFGHCFTETLTPGQRKALDVFRAPLAEAITPEIVVRVRAAVLEKAVQSCREWIAEMRAHCATLEKSL